MQWTRNKRTPLINKAASGVYAPGSTFKMAVALAGLDARAIGPADRVEHASFVPDDLLRALAAAGPKVVVQPGLVWSRGDRYLDEVAPGDHAALHRLASLDAVGLRVAMSSDAPYGPVDPWRAVAAAADRRTSSGQVLGSD